MIPTAYTRFLLLPLSLLTYLTSAQTYTNCNPLYSTGCPADTALGKSVNIDFTKGASSSFTAVGNPTYGSSGVSFTVSRSGDSPQLNSRWYIMFGKVSVVLKAAPGAGIVSSFVLQSDDLDEIDWEWLGATPDQVQTNYFGKGQTTSYNRGAFHADSGAQAGFKTYTIEWTSTQITWSINGNVVRVLTPATAEANQYPQTPMMVKIGAWSGGDPSNSQGTIAWAKGPTDYSKGPYSMVVSSVSVSDYSTGTQYKYGTTSGKWQDIVAVGGKVNSGGGGSVANIPAVTATATGQPQGKYFPHRFLTVRCESAVSRVGKKQPANLISHSHVDILPRSSQWMDGLGYWKSHTAQCGNQSG